MQRGAGEGLTEIFNSVNQKLVADFCLEMYQKMGLLDGIEVLGHPIKTSGSKPRSLRQTTLLM